MRLPLCLLILLLTVMPLAAQPLLKVAIDKEYPPYEFLDENGDVRGFTPDLLRTLAAAEGWKVQFLPLNWPDALAALEAGRVDLINMIRTPKRAETYLFSQPHSEIGQALFINTSGRFIANLDGLTGRRIALQQGDIAVSELAERSDFSRVMVQSKTEGFLLLQARKVDGFFAATQPGLRQLERSGLDQLLPIATGLFVRPLCFATTKQRSNLIATLNQGLQRLQQDGSLERLNSSWFSTPEPPSPLLLHYGRELLWGGIASVILLLGTGLLSLVLRHRVAIATSALEQANSQLDKAHRISEKARARAEIYLDVGESLIIELDRHGSVEQINDKACRLLGRKTAELLGENWCSYALPPEDRDRMRWLHGEIMAGNSEAYTKIEGQLRPTRGPLRPVLWHHRLRHSAAGEVDGLILSGQDLTDLRHAEEALEGSQQQFRELNQRFLTILESLPMAVCVLDREGRRKWANPAAEELMDQAITQPHCCRKALGIGGSCEVCTFEAILDSNQPDETIFSLPGGHYLGMHGVPVRFDGAEKPTEVILFFHDITERMRHQQEQQRTAQLVATGELAAGIAHEINNPLTGVINYSQILKGLSINAPKQHDLAGRILLEAERIAGIVTNMLGLAKQHEEKCSCFAIPDLMADTLLLIGTKMRMAGIDLQQDLPDDLPEAWGDPHMLRQVMINLLTNASYALEERHGKMVEGQRVLIDARATRGDQILLLVRDNGSGIAEDVLPRIFDPFFTTKPEEVGTGLGLSICRDILQRCGGSLEVRSEIGNYTEAIIRLKRAPETPPAEEDGA